MKTIKLPTGTFEYDPSRPLGRRGGFGQVFVGRTASGDEVAVKKLHVSAADAAHRELRITEELKGRSFSHVIPFIDSGEDADSGDYFVVMTKAERSLQSAVDNGMALDVSNAASVLLQIATGLLEVDDLVHRDLKPDNVLLHDGKWKVADFGIARFVEEATASNTLRECLSPYYAAPEQWRSERATHATDIYALGCIGFFLLTRKPPFVTDPQAEHLQAAIPAFACPDSRLLALIKMTLRKNPATRPSLTRAVEFLNAIVAKPQTQRTGDPYSQLAEVSAEVAEYEQQEQAQKEAERRTKKTRDQLAKDAFEILKDNVERLWGKIHATAPNAERHTGLERNGFACSIGPAVLTVDFNYSTEALSVGRFQRSGWDVITVARIIVIQKGKSYSWSASLWYAKLSESSEYRWYEVSYFWLSSNAFLMPSAANNTDEADMAASKGMHVLNIAFGPAEIDDEMESEFHERWIWLLSMAAKGRLAPLRQLPITNWPPAM